MSTRRKRMYLMFLIFLLIILSGNISFSQPATITLWVMKDPNIERALEKTIELFEESHPNIRVNYRILEWEEAYSIFKDISSLNADINRKGSPDVIQVPTTWSAHFINNLNLLRPLPQGMREMINRYDTTIRSTCKFKDVAYALPWFIDVRVLYYHKDVFRRLGIKNDREAVVKLNTWEDVISVCKDIKKREKIVKPIAVHGFEDVGWNILHNFVAPHYWGRVSLNEGFPDFSSKERDLNSIKEDVDFFYFKIGKFIPRWDRKREEKEIKYDFVKGLYAMYITGPYLISDLKGRYGKNWSKFLGIIPLPRGKSNAATFCGGSHLGIYRESENPSLAEEFILFLTQNPQAQIMYTSHTFQLPALYFNTEVRNKVQSNNPYSEVFYSFHMWRIYPFIPSWFDVEKTLPSIIKNWLWFRIKMFFYNIISFVWEKVLWILTVIVSAIIGYFIHYIIEKKGLPRKRKS